VSKKEVKGALITLFVIVVLFVLSIKAVETLRSVAERHDAGLKLQEKNVTIVENNLTKE